MDWEDDYEDSLDDLSAGRTLTIVDSRVQLESALHLRYMMTLIDEQGGEHYIFSKGSDDRIWSFDIDRYEGLTAFDVPLSVGQKLGRQIDALVMSTLPRRPQDYMPYNVCMPANLDY